MNLQSIVAFDDCFTLLLSSPVFYSHLFLHPFLTSRVACNQCELYTRSYLRRPEVA